MSRSWPNPSDRGGTECLRQRRPGPDKSHSVPDQCFIEARLDRGQGLSRSKPGQIGVATRRRNLSYIRFDPGSE